MKRRPATTRKRTLKAAQHPARRRQRPATEPSTEAPPDHDKRLAALARRHPEARKLVEQFSTTTDHAAVTAAAEELVGLTQPASLRPEEADRARQHDARRALDDFLATLRTAYEAEPADLPRLAEVIARAADHLRTAAASASAGPMLDKALVPAARAAVTLTDFVNGPCLQHAPQAHAAGRAEAEGWPRIHYASAARNAKADEVFCKFRIGACFPHRTAKQARPTPASLAFDRTLDALRLLLPDALRAGMFPVLPLLLDGAGRPVPICTAEGKLAAPYLELARFVVTVRHTPERWQSTRDRAVQTFLDANDAAAAGQPPALRKSYAATKRRLADLVRSLHGPAAPAPAWLRPCRPVIGTTGTRTPWSTHRDRILRTERLQVLAEALLPIYSRTVAENEARAALKALVALRYEVTGKGITGPESAARDYVAPYFDKLARLLDLPEADLRAIAAEARTEAARLTALACPRRRRAKS